MNSFEQIKLVDKLVEDCLKKLIKYIKEKNVMRLRELSNNAIEQVVLTENKNLVYISLISYAFSKLLSKPHLEKKQWQILQKHVMRELEKKEKLELILKEIIQDVSRFDISTGNYLLDLIEKARIKQASRIYAMGLSLGRAAYLTEVDKEQLLAYVGATKIHDRPFTKSKTVKERYKIMRKILEEKK